MNKVSRLITLFCISTLSLLFVVTLWQTNEGGLEKKHSNNDELPAPTELLDGQNEEKGMSARKAYEKALHRAAPKTDWKALDRQNMLKMYHKRVELKNNLSLKSNTTYADGHLTGEWTERGSQNQAGNLSQVVYSADGDKLFGISGSGTFWSGNLDGTGWTPVNEDLKLNKNLLKIVPDGNGGRRLLATVGKIVWYSDDDGANWATSTGLDFYNTWGEPRDLVTINDANNTIYYLVKTWNSNPWGAATQLYVSEDRGATFTLMTNYQQGQADRIGLWAASEGTSAYLLVNGSELRTLSGNTSTLLNTNSTLPTTQSLKLTGTKTESGTTLSVLANRNTVYQSTNNGATWTLKGTTPVNAWGVGMVASAHDPNKLFMGAVDCYRSYDGGVNWTKVNGWGQYYGNNNYLHADIMDIEPFTKADGTSFVLVANHGGVHASYDDLQTTSNLGVEGLNIGQYYDVRTDPLDHAFVYGGTQDQGHHRSNLGYTEGVVNFDQVVSGDYGSYAFSENGQRLWTVYPGATIHYYPNPQTQNKKAQFSIGGNHKAASGWIIPTSPVADTNENAILIAGGNINGGDGSYLVKLTATSSAPYSITAEQYDYDFRANSNNGTATIAAISVSTLSANKIYVGMSDGTFFHSNDNGTTWVKAADFSGPTQSWIHTTTIYASKANADVVYFGGSGYSNPGVYKSTDGGQTFSEMATGLPNTLVRDLTANDDESMIFAATDVGAFVYVVADNEWYEFLGAEAPQQSYRSVEFIPSLQRIRMATYGRGIWDFQIDCEETTYYADLDGDGFGDANNSLQACAVPPSYVTDNTDCNDASDLTYSNALEICDGLDNNCDGQIDEGFDIACGDYCAPGHWGGQNEMISQVTLGTIDNSSTAWATGTGYSDYTNVSTDLLATETHTITVNTNYGWAGSKMGIWIDFNKNIQFDNDELIANFTGNGPHTATFTLPQNAYEGVTRLRIRYQYSGGNDPIGPCNGTGYSGGETEDYTVNLIACINTFYADLDGDGFGDANNTIETCEMPAGYVTDNTDCNDNDANNYIGATCDDGNGNTILDVVGANCVCAGTPVEEACGDNTEFVNVAIGKTATQASIGWNGSASRAIDGNTSGVWGVGSVSHTGYTAQAWWEVDLEEVQDIQEIHLWNRTDCCTNRLSNFYVFVSETPFTSTDPSVLTNQTNVWSQFVEETPMPKVTLAATTSGRYVRVQLANTNYLSLAEVEVMACQAITDVNYCASQGDNTTYEHIETVTIGNVTNNSGNDNGYGDYTSQTVLTNIGETVSVDLEPGFGYGTYVENWKVWIDFNKDGDFDDANEEVFAPAGSSATITGMFAIPTNVSLGTTTLRVSMVWNNEPTTCGSFTYGEVEDYQIVIGKENNATNAGKTEGLGNSNATVFTTPSLLTTGTNRSITKESTAITELIDVTLTPNPATEWINIQGHISGETTDGEPIQLLIFDAQGNLVLEEMGVEVNNQSVREQIAISHLPEGVYFLKIIIRKRTVSKKFFKAG